MSKQVKHGSPRLADVAARAGVSMSTASMVLGSKGRISLEVRDRVRAAAQELGYNRVPRSVARTLSSGILFLLDRKWVWTFNMIQAITASLELSLRESGRLLTIIPITEDEPIGHIKQRVQAAGVDSVFSIHYAESHLFQELEAAGIPVAVIMNNNFQTQFNSVCVDDYQGAYEAGRILITNGHRFMAYMSADIPMLSAVRSDRLIGFRKALSESGMSLGNDADSLCNFRSMNNAEDSVQCVMAADPQPTALYIMDDYIGVRVYLALKRLGYRIPEDVSILCAGDVLDYREPFIPAISTMRIQFETMGRAAAEMMISQLKQDTRRRQHEVLKVKQHYVDRGTVRNLNLM